MSKHSTTLHLGDLPDDLLGDTENTEDDFFAPAPTPPAFLFSTPPQHRMLDNDDKPRRASPVSGNTTATAPTGPVIVLPSPQMRANRMEQARSRGNTPVSQVRSLEPASPATNIDDIVAPPSGVIDLSNNNNNNNKNYNFSSNLGDRDKYRKKVPLSPTKTHWHWTRFSEPLPKPESAPFISPSELAKHNTPNDAWICVDSCVYDITAYLPYHPGGKQILLDYCGKDATDMFKLTHSFVAHQILLEKFVVGWLNKNAQ